MFLIFEQFEKINIFYLFIYSNPQSPQGVYKPKNGLFLKEIIIVLTVFVLKQQWFWPQTFLCSFLYQQLSSKSSNRTIYYCSSFLSCYFKFLLVFFSFKNNTFHTQKKIISISLPFKMYVHGKKVFNLVFPYNFF